MDLDSYSRLEINLLMSSVSAPSLHAEQLAANGKPLAAGRWLNVVTHLDPKFGGLSAVVPQLASMVGACGFNTSLAAFCAPDEHCNLVDHADLQVTRWPAGRSAWYKDRSYQASFNALLDQQDGLHVHGLWEQSTFVAARAARARKLPYVLSAHGMLEQWALKNKRWKKLAYSALIERANVAGASCLHALTLAEAEDYRHYGAKGPIAIIPNGVSIPEHLSPKLFLAQNSALQGKRIVLFLGRIHYKKGLDLLIEAWREIALRHSDAHLVLVGPDFEGTRARVEAAIRQEGLSDRVLFTGMLQGNLKWSALAAAECFVLPSYSEGLSVSTLEAMGVGLPVIISERCNLPEVREHDAGWVIPAAVAPLRRALEEFLSNSVETNHQIGERGRKLVRERYEWSSVARQMGEVYQWLEGGHAPMAVTILKTGASR